MKIGMIGVGGMGSTHNSAVKALSETKNIAVTAIADGSPENLEKAALLWPEARTFSDGMEMLEKEELDCVHICLPSYMHADYAVAAMNRGIHVLVEKPMALTEEDCARMIEARDRNHVCAMVGQVVRFFPEYLFLKNVYEQGTCGKLKSLVMQRLSQNVLWGSQNWFQDETKSGSVVLDLHIHDGDFLLYMLGEPQSLHVQATAYATGMINQIITTYSYPGFFATAEALWDTTPVLPFHPSYRAYFEKGTVTYDGREHPSVKVWKPDGSVEIPELHGESPLDSCASGINIQSLGSYYTEIKYFYDCLEKGLSPEIASLEEAAASVKLMLRELSLAHEACRNGVPGNPAR